METPRQSHKTKGLRVRQLPPYRTLNANAVYRYRCLSMSVTTVFFFCVCFSFVFTVALLLSSLTSEEDTARPKKKSKVGRVGVWLYSRGLSSSTTTTTTDQTATISLSVLCQSCWFPRQERRTSAGIDRIVSLSRYIYLACVCVRASPRTTECISLAPSFRFI